MIYTTVQLSGNQNSDYQNISTIENENPINLQIQQIESADNTSKQNLLKISLATRNLNYDLKKTNIQEIINVQIQNIQDGLMKKDYNMQETIRKYYEQINDNKKQHQQMNQQVTPNKQKKKCSNQLCSNKTTNEFCYRHNDTRRQSNLNRWSHIHEKLKQVDKLELQLFRERERSQSLQRNIQQSEDPKYLNFVISVLYESLKQLDPTKSIIRHLKISQDDFIKHQNM